MIYTINLSIVDLVGMVLGVFLLGMLTGWKFLPPPIDTKKEELIDRLFNENMKLKIKEVLK